MKSFFDLLVCSHAPNKVWSVLKSRISVCTRKLRPLTCSRQLNLHLDSHFLIICKNFAPIEKSTQQTAQLLATNMSLRLCLQTKQYTYYFKQIFDLESLPHCTIKKRLHFFCFRSEIHQCFVANQFLFLSSMKQRTK